MVCTQPSTYLVKVDRLFLIDPRLTYISSMLHEKSKRAQTSIFQSMVLLYLWSIADLWFPVCPKDQKCRHQYCHSNPFIFLSPSFLRTERPGWCSHSNLLSSFHLLFCPAYHGLLNGSWDNPAYPKTVSNHTLLLLGYLAMLHMKNSLQMALPLFWRFEWVKQASGVAIQQKLALWRDPGIPNDLRVTIIFCRLLMKLIYYSLT